ncbi:hypothetical protein G6M26_35220 [Agrobacterium tumefaciens]|nr:hypothetical protein [Agrobacterium tumefaciens]NTE23805.1 hypothetical protein [Agrobacterium tumefaciens]
MNTKLTLTIDESVIKRAKAYAEEQGRSLSAVVENYLKAVTKIEKKNDEEFSPSLKNLIGSVKLPKDFDYKKIRDEYLTEKYISND